MISNKGILCWLFLAFLSFCTLTYSHELSHKAIYLEGCPEALVKIRLFDGGGLMAASLESGGPCAGWVDGVQAENELDYPYLIAFSLIIPTLMLMMMNQNGKE
jgi:hypothetical protein